MSGNDNLAPEHLRFAVLATDIVLFTVHNGQLLVRLTPVHRPPHFPTSKGFPGGLILPKETGHDAALRLLHDKGNIAAHKVYVEQLFTFSKIGRDPRGRVVSVAYLALVPWEHLSPDEQRNTSGSWWSQIPSATQLAYDHDEMLKVALERLRSRVTYTTLVGKLMSDSFTLTELESTYEVVLGKGLDKRNFRKKILKLNVLKELPDKRTGGRFRPAQLYTFASKEVRQIELL